MSNPRARRLVVTASQMVEYRFVIETDRRDDVVLGVLKKADFDPEEHEIEPYYPGCMDFEIADAYIEEDLECDPAFVIDDRGLHMRIDHGRTESTTPAAIGRCWGRSSTGCFREQERQPAAGEEVHSCDEETEAAGGRPS